jgi:hypothetical protein
MLFCGFASFLPGRIFSKCYTWMSINAEVQYYKDNIPQKQQVFEFKNNRSVITLNDAVWECKKETGASGADNETVHTFQLTNGKADKAGVAVKFVFNNWDESNYVIIPAAAYNGNRFDVLKYGYPPLFKKEDYKKNLPVTISNVPRLNKEAGESRMDLNTGDLSTPAVGIYFPKTKNGIWILTAQATELGNSVLIFKENEQRNKG